MLLLWVPGVPGSVLPTVALPPAPEVKTEEKKGLAEQV